MKNIEISEFCPENLLRRREIEYGTIDRVTYQSTTSEREKRLVVLLPAGYRADKKYPVLYCLHGIFGNEETMIGDGNSGLRILLGNMIADGLAKEMIVVCPHMYCSKKQPDCTGFDDENTTAYDNIVYELADDIMPFIAQNYSVATGKKNTALCGFSMGGRETLAVTIARPDLIGYACAISSAPGIVYAKDSFMEHKGMFSEDAVSFGAEKPYLLLCCAGDRDSVVGQFPKSYHELLEKNGAEHIWWEIKGSDHGDPAISSGLYQIFRNSFTEEV